MTQHRRDDTTIFGLHEAVLADYRDFVRSYFTIADERAREEETGIFCFLSVVETAGSASLVWWSQRDSNPCLSLERAPS